MYTNLSYNQVWIYHVWMAIYFMRLDTPSKAQSMTKLKSKDDMPSQRVEVYRSPPNEFISDKDCFDASTISQVEAIYDYDAKDTEELSFQKGDRLAIVDKPQSNWWMAKNEYRAGLIPANYVHEVEETVRHEGNEERVMTEILSQRTNIKHFLNLVERAKIDKNLNSGELQVRAQFAYIHACLIP